VPNIRKRFKYDSRNALSMHFMVNKKNKVSKIHMELWDKQLLGKALIAKIKGYKNKEYKQFLKFLLKQKTFLRTRILWMGMPDRVVWLWSAPAVYGKPAYDQTIKGVSALKLSNGFFAEMRLKTKKGLFIMFEALLAAAFSKLKMPRHVIELDFTEKQAFDIVKDFNITRNLQSFLLFYSNKKILKANFKGPCFVGFNKNECLEPLTAKELKALTKTKLKKYKKFMALASEDKEDAEKSKKILKGLKKFGFASQAKSFD
jgi:hypothetical protein